MSTTLGYIGLICFALAWLPQSWETIRAGRCDINRFFLALTALGSFSLTLYALSRGNAVFACLNTLTTTGAAVNGYYSFFPRRIGTIVAPLTSAGDNPVGQRARPSGS